MRGLIIAISLAGTISQLASLLIIIPSISRVLSTRVAGKSRSSLNSLLARQFQLSASALVLLGTATAAHRRFQISPFQALSLVSARAV